ncbi:hypothetical protein N752_27260 [Desulforamulus aquiferis]|nr:sialidase family protein [Desulforamulus aquiferis]RYD02153.1 hypothetical protein N752_27260 [Desulforamulus aquiferis]
MNSKVLKVLNTTKKKAGVAILCGALVTTLGTGTAFAESSNTIMLGKFEKGQISYSSDRGQTWNENVPDGAPFNIKEGKVIIGIAPEGGSGILVKNENGNKMYSTDGGETWSENIPEGFPAFNVEAGKSLEV